MTAAPSADGHARRPRILVTRAEEVIGERWDDYADCLEAAGADWEALDLEDWRPGTRIEGFDGVLISAGLDVDPACYGETPSSYVTAINAMRDEFETALLRGRPRARSAGAGDLPRAPALQRRARRLAAAAHRRARAAPRPQRQGRRNRLRLARGDAGRWFTARGSVRRAIAERVNSRHHQAVTPDRLAPGLRVAATTADGIVEALERPDRRWAVSVQWHPEREEIADQQRPLFESFVAACAETAAPDAG